MLRISTHRKNWKSLAATAALAIAAVIFSIGSVQAQNADTSRNNILFTQQDQVKEFNFTSATSAVGYQVGTAVGKISGTTSVAFSAEVLDVPPNQPNLKFTNYVIITDLDGDQITFLNEGLGFFIPPVITVPGFWGSGGPLFGTYIADEGTGKYKSWKGKTFKYRAVATNPPWGYKEIVPLGALGTVYVEVYSNPLK